MKNKSTLFLLAIMVLVLSHIQVNAQNNSSAPAGLNAKQQTIVKIAALTATGTATGQLKKALNDGLSAGLTINEIKEVLVHLYAYCGFPRSLNGLTTFMAVVEERKAQGLKDVMGKEATPVTDTNKYETGKKTLEKLSGQPVGQPTTGYGAFAPVIDTFLKEHLFADIFSRDVLTYAERELTTITALASMEGLAPQLQGHLGLGLNVGLSENQLQQVLSLIESTINKKQADAGRAVLAKVLAEKK